MQISGGAKLEQRGVSLSTHSTLEMCIRDSGGAAEMGFAVERRVARNIMRDVGDVYLKFEVSVGEQSLSLIHI